MARTTRHASDSGSSGTIRRLPVNMTSFIGREREISEITALLDQPDVRLVTLIGPGGVGKTRLALEVARRLQPDFADGAVFVRLATISDPALAPVVVAHAVGGPEGATLPDRLDDQHLLLVLDNVEHLLDQPPLWLVELLGECARVTVLATSREALNLGGEHRYVVPPLTVPYADAPDCDAVRLFAQRARSLRPEFAISDRNVPAVVDICRAVDGLPLAIELAASRIVLLTPAEIASHLSHRLRLLAGGQRDAPERMRSLRATFDWSYDLLSRTDQQVFRQLSVFVGGFDLWAAEAVITQGDLDLVGSIASLVDKSLLQVVMRSGNEARFVMLETLREYGQERLAATPDERAVRDRHADWYLELARSIDPSREHVRQPEPSEVERLDLEYGNIRAALNWLDASGREADLATFVMRLRSFWYLTERFSEALAWYERIQPPDEFTRIALLRMRGQMAQILGRAGAQELVEASLARARAANDPYQEAEARFHLAIMAEDRGDYAEAEAGFCAARELFTQVGNRLGATQSLYHLGVVAYGQHRLDVAERLLADSIHAARDAGDTLLPWWAATYQMLIAAEIGDLGRATALLGSQARAIGVPAHRHHTAELLATASVIAVDLGQLAAAARLFGAAGRNRVPFMLPERVAFDRAAEQARRGLGDAEFEREQAAGRRLSVDALQDELDRLAGQEPQPLPETPRPSADVPDLTARELQVLRLLADGFSNREIAEQLFVSLRTAATHVDHILTKLDVRSRTAAVAYAIRHGIA